MSSKRMATGATLLVLCTAVAGCDSPFEELFPPRVLTIEAEDTDYAVRTQYDPFQFAYYTEIIPVRLRSAPLDRETALFLVENEVGPVVCDGGKLAFDEGLVWSITGDGPITHLPSRGGWQIVARCA